MEKAVAPQRESMRKEDQNFIRISGTVTSPIKISPNRNLATFELSSKNFSRVGIKHNVFDVRWYDDEEKLGALKKGDRIAVLGQAAAHSNNKGEHEFFLLSKEIVFY